MSHARLPLVIMLAGLLTAHPSAASPSPATVRASQTPIPLAEDICREVLFGSDTEERTISESGVAWESQVSEGLIADTIQMTAVLAAEPPAEVRIALAHNGGLLAQWSQMVSGSRFTPYPHAFARAVELSPGDMLRFEVHADGPPTVSLRISGPNVVQICSRGVVLPAPVYVPMVARKALGPTAQPTVPMVSPAPERARGR